MTTYPVTVELPESIYKRVERTAKGLKQPVSQALLKIVEAGLPSLSKVPSSYQAELAALEALSDQELWKIAQREMPQIQQERLETLLWKNQATGLSEEEALEVEQLHTEADRLMLLKSYAYVLLKWRGHQVPDLTH